MVGIGGGLWTDDVTTGIDIAITGGSIAGNSAYEGGGAYVNDGTTDISQVDRQRQYRLGGRRGVLDRDLHPTRRPRRSRQSTISANTVTGTADANPFLGDGGGILAYGPSSGATHSR